MASINRRGVLIGAAAGAAAAGGLAAVTPGNAAEPAVGSVAERAAVRPGDPRYAELVVGNNRRFVARPEAVRLVRDADQVVRAVRDAVRAGKRVTVRSGGHCYADFVYNDATQVVIDLSTMDRIDYDERRRAFSVEAGAQLGDVYATLYRGWGVVVPGGVCLTVGVGGHACGGGYGLLSRRYGVVADHIEAVEVVVVDRDGDVRKVVASRDPRDPNHDLWWACTGGGGGNFGIITRYWFRSADARGSDPGEQLPRPPREVLVHRMGMPWQGLSLTAFTNLLRNYGDWHVANTAADSPYAALSGGVFLAHKASGGIGLLTQMDATLPGAERLLADYLAAVSKDTGMFIPPARRLPWLAATRKIGTADPALLTDPTKRGAVKSAYMRKGFTDAQIATLYRNMTRDDYANPTATLQLYGVAGGRVNTVPPGATAYVHRDAAFLALFENFWDEAAEDPAHLRWLRETYADAFAATGGYPVPNAQTGGCYINSPDPEIRDLSVNRSGVPWSTLYYGANYPRLRQVKSRWDPTNFFRHSQSVEPA
ncbi:FAD-binding protein [Actinokineospora sp. NBRC 105648]|uniref:FAD-binding oxidoreductase n=1 Tax=Actinokineospora sp. NBRC 105648 TaxID=3032206 RepID=UPI0024A2FE46|nr:FAD-binding protein [Actinokineospora sp. NBRC 105648]GLZ38898.1 FAD-linked oxidase [Actinokineospora sp. NBRC 105648]